MLQVDLNRLRAEHRVTLLERVAPDAELLRGTEIRLAGPLEVEVEAQDAGGDIVVRGRMEGALAVECRRCLKAAQQRVEEDLSAVFTPREETVEPGAGDVYLLPAEKRTLELAELVREQLLLAVDPYPVCEAACRGLCPHCGADLNETECGCVVEEEDERWAPLRKLKKD